MVYAVSDPDSFFKDQDPGIFFQSGSGSDPDSGYGSTQKKLIFSKAI